MLGFFELLKNILFFTGYVHTGSFPEALSKEEQEKLLDELENGSFEARNLLIEHNLRLVVHIAKKYAEKSRELDDLISIGTIGLIKAVTTFQRGRGTSLASYAARCIENEILMSIRLEKKTSLEISIDDPLGTDSDGNEITYADKLFSPFSVSDSVEAKVLGEGINEKIRLHLNKREQTVVELRYGLTNGYCMPQREVAKILGISRSYVSRIEKRALQKLGAHVAELM